MNKNGITLLSERDPIGRCRKIADAVEISDKTLYFCPSPLYGYGLNELLIRLKKEAPNSAVLCIEADPELSEQFAGSIESSVREQLEDSLHHTKDKICFANTCEPAELCALVRDRWGTRTFRRIEMVKLTGGWQLYPDLYNSLYEKIKSEINLNWSNVLTITKLGRLYIKNFLRNLRLLLNFKSIGELSFGNCDVLVLGAGPSLDEYIDKYPQLFCDQNKRKVKIICVDSCLGALKDRNIIPDLAVILESQHWNLRDFTGCKGWNVPFAVDMSALSASAFMLEGEGYLFMTPWTELEIFNRMKEADILPEIIPPLGSVGLAAMHIARCLTTGNITRAGFDFSFTIDKTHARGTPGHCEKLYTHNRFGGLISKAAFGYGVIREGIRYTTPNMRNYKELVLREFNNKTETIAQRRKVAKDAEKNLNEFIKSEINRLIELRDILTGKKTCNLLPAAYNLLKECDYLWAHFPDYAGGVEPNVNDTSFLNRIRIEIDQMLKFLNHEPH